METISVLKTPFVTKMADSMKRAGSWITDNPIIVFLTTIFTVGLATFGAFATAVYLLIHLFFNIPTILTVRWMMKRRDQGLPY